MLALDQRIRLIKSFEAFEELGEVVGVLRFDGDSDDWGHRELLLPDEVGFVSAYILSDGCLFYDVLVDAHKRAVVSGGNVGDLFNRPTHLHTDSLDVFDVEVGFLAGLVVGAHDADFLAGFHCA